MDIIEAFKLLSKKLFAQEINFPEGFSKYKNALEISINIEGVNSNDKLLLTLFDIIYLENDIPKKEIDSNLIKYFKLCIEDKLNDDIFNYYINKEKSQLSDSLINNKILTSKEIILLSFLIKIKKDFNLFFKCFEEIYKEKCAQFIPSEYSESRFGAQSFEEYLNDFSLCYNMLDTKSKGYFSLIYDDKGWFLTKEKTKKDYKEFKSRIRKSKINDLIDFIQNNTNINNKKIQVQKTEEDKKEISVINAEILLKKIERLEFEIEEMKKLEIIANKTHQETIKNLNIENSIKINDLKKAQIELENKNLKLEAQNANITEKINQLKIENIRLNEDLKKMKKELDSLKAKF